MAARRAHAQRGGLAGTAFAAAAIVAWGLLLVAGGGPLGPALATFAIGVVFVLGLVALRQAVVLRRARRAAELERGRARAAQLAFVSDASHQLRTPLAALRLRLDDLDGRLAQTPLARTTGAAAAEVDRLERLVNDLLALTAERSAGAPVPLAALVRDVARTLEPLAASREVTLEVDTGDGGPAVDPGLRDALAALVENAVLYTARGTGVRVEVREGAVEVSDRGPGLAPDEGARVFERFARGQAAAGRDDGTGLGLPIARASARRAGAEVTLANRDDGPGARATLRLAKVRDP